MRDTATNAPAQTPSREGGEENPPSNRVEHLPSLLATADYDKRAAEYSELGFPIFALFASLT